MKALRSLFAILTIVLCTSFFSSSAQAYNGNLEDISVSGTAEKSYTPDMAYVYFTIVGNGTTSDEAAATAANKAAAVKRTLLANGITSEALETSSYNLSPIYNDKQKITGYCVNNSLKLKVENLDKLGNTIDKLADAGVDKVNYITYDLRNMKLYMQQLMGQAVQNARQQAEVIANAGGRTLGRMVHANTNSNFNTPRVYANRAIMKSADATESTVIETKDVKLSASVDVVFALQ